MCLLLLCMRQELNTGYWFCWRLPNSIMMLNFVCVYFLDFCIIFFLDESQLWALNHMALSPITNNEDVQRFVRINLLTLCDLNATHSFQWMHYHLGCVGTFIFSTSHFNRNNKCLNRTTNGFNISHRQAKKLRRNHRVDCNISKSQFHSNSMLLIHYKCKSTWVYDVKNP